MRLLAGGFTRKMRVTLDNGQAVYHWRFDKETCKQSLNDFVGSPVRLHYRAEIQCVHCGRPTNKSFNQGYCYPCFQKLAQCDLCIMRPETCHYHAGTCREPEWAESHCMTPHIVYLANTSGLKIGLTRGTQIPTRWIDQGAAQALPILQTTSRYQAGAVEKCGKELFNDVTDWRAMLRGEPQPVDLPATRDLFLMELEGMLAEWNAGDPPEEVVASDRLDGGLTGTPIDIRYPVADYPVKLKSHNFDKNDTLEGTLHGIKGQYMMIGEAVVNIRKYGGYGIDLYA